jgi:hypothetical protein
MLDTSPIWGLAEGSKVTEAIERHDGTATRYKVAVATLDLNALRQEKETLEAMLAIEEPSTNELVELGKTSHPFYLKEELQERLDRINEILG